MTIRPKTALQTDLGEITRICLEKAEPVYLTQDGEGELVIMSIETFEKREAMFNLRAKLMDAEQQRMSGVEPYTTSQVREYIKGLHDANI